MERPPALRFAPLLLIRQILSSFVCQMENNIKTDKISTLYVSDLDGTLLNPDSRVSERSAAILNRLVERGVMFTPATARTPATVQPSGTVSIHALSSAASSTATMPRRFIAFLCAKSCARLSIA